MIDYKCSKCGDTNCKLWRSYCVMLNQVDLLCVVCAEGPLNLDADGRYFHPRFGQKTDQFNGLVPAVPTIEMDTYWGYCAVPDERVKWWRSLPTFAASCKDVLQNGRWAEIAEYRKLREGTADE